MIANQKLSEENHLIIWKKVFLSYEYLHVHKEFQIIVSNLELLDLLENFEFNSNLEDFTIKKGEKAESLISIEAQNFHEKEAQEQENCISLINSLRFIFLISFQN